MPAIEPSGRKSFRCVRSAWERLMRWPAVGLYGPRATGTPLRDSKVMRDIGDPVCQKTRTATFSSTHTRRPTERRTPEWATEQTPKQWGSGAVYVTAARTGVGPYAAVSSGP